MRVIRSTYRGAAEWRAQRHALHWQTGALWRNRDFLLLWAGQAISSIGTQISSFALPLLCWH
jgi:hypothetical protein